MSGGQSEPWNQWLYQTSLAQSDVEHSLPLQIRNHSHEGYTSNDRQTNGHSQPSKKIEVPSFSLGTSLSGSMRQITGPSSSINTHIGEAMFEDDDWAVHSMEGMEGFSTSPGLTGAGQTARPGEVLNEDFPMLSPTLNSFPNEMLHAELDLASPLLDEDDTWTSDFVMPNNVHSAAGALSLGPPYPSSMTIPPSSARFEEDVASSWPPSSNHWPPYFIASMVAQASSDQPTAEMPIARPRGNTIAIGLTEISSPHQRPLAIRTKKRGPVRKSRSNSLSENKNSPTLARVPARKGGRTTKLSETQAPMVADKRHKRIVCICCRVRRVSVCP